MIVVNFFGEPGAGKSTMAAAVFAELRFRGVRAELVTEYAKELLWHGNLHKTEQRDILYVQYWRQRALLSWDLEVAVTDSPLMMQGVYDIRFAREALERHAQFNNRNYLVRRLHGYEQVGRSQNEGEALAIRAKIYDLLYRAGATYTETSSGAEEARDVAAVITEGLS